VLVNNHPLCAACGRRNDLRKKNDLTPAQEKASGIDGDPLVRSYSNIVKAAFVISAFLKKIRTPQKTRLKMGEERLREERESGKGMNERSS
jgi:hypothetical protein